MVAKTTPFVNLIITGRKESQELGERTKSTTRAFPNEYSIENKFHKVLVGVFCGVQFEHAITMRLKVKKVLLL